MAPDSSGLEGADWRPGIGHSRTAVLFDINGMVTIGYYRLLWVTIGYSGLPYTVG